MSIFSTDPNYQRRDKRLKARHDALIQNECVIAAAIMREVPGMSRSDALREAAIIAAKEQW